VLSTKDRKVPKNVSRAGSGAATELDFRQIFWTLRDSGGTRFNYFGNNRELNGGGEYHQGILPGPGTEAQTKTPARQINRQIELILLGDGPKWRELAN
jgi:hypothetical protein